MYSNAVFNCSNRADREKDNSNHRFPSNVKNNDKEGVKVSKVRRGKSGSSNFQEIFNSEKARKNKNKNQTNTFCLPFVDFLHTKFTISDSESKCVFYPN